MITIPRNDFFTTSMLVKSLEPHVVRPRLSATTVRLVQLLTRQPELRPSAHRLFVDCNDLRIVNESCHHFAIKGLENVGSLLRQFHVRTKKGATFQKEIRAVLASGGFNPHRISAIR